MFLVAIIQIVITLPSLEGCKHPIRSFIFARARLKSSEVWRRAWILFVFLSHSSSPESCVSSLLDDYDRKSPVDQDAELLEVRVGQ